MSHLLSDMFDAELESHAGLLLQYVFTFKTKTTQCSNTVHKWTKDDNLKSEVPMERDGCIESENHQLFPALEMHKSWIIAVVC